MSKQLDLFADAIAERVARLLASRTAPDYWTSADLPPDCPSKRRFRQVCQGIPGAAKRGRMWFVPRGEWDFARGSR